MAMRITVLNHLGEVTQVIQNFEEWLVSYAGLGFESVISFRVLWAGALVVASMNFNCNYRN